MQMGKILIAEDDPVLREAYVRKFARSGYTIRTAENGDQASQMIKEEAPDLLVCDIMMPGHDGWWVLGQFPKGKRPFLVIMLTNLADTSTRDRSQKEADGYFVKKDMTLLTLVSMATSLLSDHSGS
ncbi:response regulator [Candidatus Peribacteria bacterium]|nr:response regulator [Candidatus Peribacteria bacterium]